MTCWLCVFYEVKEIYNGWKEIYNLEETGMQMLKVGLTVKIFRSFTSS